MRLRTAKTRATATLVSTAATLLTAAAAIASGSITDNSIGFLTLAPGKTRTLSVAYPDALKYANATYSGKYVLRAVKSKLRAPDLAKVKILYAGSVLGGSAYAVHADNTNPAGTAAVRISVTATTVEPLPHH
jgi:hypothetical protein